MTWTQIDQHGLVPSSRSGHAICQLGPNIILTGGLGLVNDAPVAHDDVFLFDFGMCLYNLYRNLALYS